MVGCQHQTDAGENTEQVVSQLGIGAPGPVVADQPQGEIQTDGAVVYRQRPLALEPAESGDAEADHSQKAQYGAGDAGQGEILSQFRQRYHERTGGSDKAADGTGQGGREVVGEPVGALTCPAVQEDQHHRGDGQQAQYPQEGVSGHQQSLFVCAGAVQQGQQTQTHQTHTGGDEGGNIGFEIFQHNSFPNSKTAVRMGWCSR